MNHPRVMHLFPAIMLQDRIHTTKREGRSVHKSGRTPGWGVGQELTSHSQVEGPSGRRCPVKPQSSVRVSCQSPSHSPFQPLIYVRAAQLDNNQKLPAGKREEGRKSAWRGRRGRSFVCCFPPSSQLTHRNAHTITVSRFCFILAKRSLP